MMPLDEGHDYRTERELLREILGELQKPPSDQKVNARWLERDYKFGNLGMGGFIPGVVVDNGLAEMEYQLVGPRTFRFRLHTAFKTIHGLESGPWIEVGG